MPRNAPAKEERHKRGGKGMVFGGVIVIIIGLMLYFQVTWPLVLVIVGILIALFGLARMSQP